MVNINFCVILLALIASTRAERISEQAVAIRALLEHIRPLMCYEDPRFLSFTLEPYKWNVLPFNVDYDFLNVHGGFFNIRVEGLSKFILDLLIADAPEYDLQFTVPQLKITADYIAEGDMADIIKINGNDKLVIIVDGVHFGAYAQFHYQYEFDRFKLQGLNTTFSIDALDVNLKGLTSDPELNQFINEILSMSGPEFVDQLSPSIQPYIEDLIKDVVNILLKDVSNEKIFDVLGGYVDPLPPIDPAKACKFNGFF